MYAITYYEQSWIYPIHRILIILVRAAFSFRIQISLLEVHGGRVQSMVATNGALRPLSSRLADWGPGLWNLDGVKRTFG